MGDEKLQAQFPECSKSDCQGFIMDNLCENLGATQIERGDLYNKVEVLFTEEDQDYIGKINELHAYLDTIQKKNWKERIMGDEEVKLFRTWSSPYALRIVWALKLKGVEYETVYEEVSHKSDALIGYNPVHRKVPVLVHNGKPIAESLVILEYIDETWKQHPLLSDQPHQRALARFWAKFGDEKVLPAIWEAFTKQGKEQEEALSTAVENLKYLEEELKGKKLFGGEEIGLVDIALGWLANLVSVFEEITGLNLIPEEKFPLLLNWMQVFADIPVIKESWPPRDKLVVKFHALREASLAKEAEKDK